MGGTAVSTRWKRYGYDEMHELLAAKLYRGDTDPDNVSPQALFCPYYLSLSGQLGSDWGVILNPESAKFATVVFEHDHCGCPVDAEGRPTHGQGNQNDRDWMVREK